MVVGFTATYAICAYHHWCCEFEYLDQGCTTLCDKVCQWLMTGRWFSPGPPVSSTNKTDKHANLYTTDTVVSSSGVLNENWYRGWCFLFPERPHIGICHKSGDKLGMIFIDLNSSLTDVRHCINTQVC